MIFIVLCGFMGKDRFSPLIKNYRFFLETLFYRPLNNCGVLRKLFSSTQIGGCNEITVFLIFLKHYAESKKQILVPDIMRKNCFQIYIFINFKHKILAFSFQFLPPPPQIFQTKHIGIIPTV